MARRARALGSGQDDRRWPSRLAAWGLGKIKDADLASGARTPGQRTESSFYRAVALRIAGDRSSAAALLAEVAIAP